jgi:hypothetical protein
MNRIPKDKTLKRDLKLKKERGKRRPYVWKKSTNL